MSNAPLVELTNICKYYASGEAEVRALDGVDLTITVSYTHLTLPTTG